MINMIRDSWYDMFLAVLFLAGTASILYLLFTWPHS
jgi:hypothetical protein